MPLASLRACPGRCGALTRGGRCHACAQTQAATREAARPRLRERGWYHTERWRRLRARFLAEHPLCAVCRRPANTVDHIEPHRMDDTKFWAVDNLQPMCAACHSSKTAREDGGFGHARRA